jgi:hypothetical protein
MYGQNGAILRVELRRRAVLLVMAALNHHLFTYLYVC